MSPQEQKCHVIIVHYGDWAVTERAMAALEKGGVKPTEIIIVDNNEPNNRGYAGGINYGLGVLLSKGVDKKDVVIVMNNDLKVSSETLVKVIELVQNNEKTFVGPEMRFVNLVTGKTSVSSQLSVVSCQYLHGAFIAARFNDWALMQGMPDKYFLYWEDVAFGHRLAQSGFKQIADSSLVVQYDEKQKPKDNHLYYLARNGAYWLANDGPKVWRPWWHLVNSLRYYWHKIVSGKKVVVQALLDARQGNLGKRDDD